MSDDVTSAMERIRRYVDSLATDEPELLRQHIADIRTLLDAVPITPEYPSATAAFAALREASGGRWDNVDPEAFVRELRADDSPHWHARPTCPGLWISWAIDQRNRFGFPNASLLRLDAEAIADGAPFDCRICYGPIPAAPETTP